MTLQSCSKFLNLKRKKDQRAPDCYNRAADLLENASTHLSSALEANQSLDEATLQHYRDKLQKAQKIADGKDDSCVIQ